MKGRIKCLSKNPKPIGSDADFWDAVEFDDGVIWISQDCTFFEELNGNDTMVLCNES